LHLLDAPFSNKISKLQLSDYYSDGLLEAAAALARLCAAMRLFVNFLQPSFKLAGKARNGAKWPASLYGSELG
jgi:hypothetical protein